MLEKAKKLARVFEHHLERITSTHVYSNPSTSTLKFHQNVNQHFFFI